MPENARGGGGWLSLEACSMKTPAQGPRGHSTGRAGGRLAGGGGQAGRGGRVEGAPGRRGLSPALCIVPRARGAGGPGPAGDSPGCKRAPKSCVRGAVRGSLEPCPRAGNLRPKPGPDLTPFGLRLIMRGGTRSRVFYVFPRSHTYWARGMFRVFPKHFLIHLRDNPWQGV